MKDEIMIENCRKLLRQIAWRLQYGAKKRYIRENPLIEEIHGNDITSTIISDIFVEQLLQEIPERPRYIIKSIVIEGKTEQEVAQQLKITRQGVSKCKNKYLRILAQKTNHLV